MLLAFHNEIRRGAGSTPPAKWAGRSGLRPATINSTDEYSDSWVAAALVMDDTVMNNPILTLELRRKRDVLVARHHARQLAGLLRTSQTLRAMAEAS